MRVSQRYQPGAPSERHECYGVKGVGLGEAGATASGSIYNGGAREAAGQW